MKEGKNNSIFQSDFWDWKTCLLALGSCGGLVVLALVMSLNNFDQPAQSPYLLTSVENEVSTLEKENADSKFVELELEQLSSPFTKETVLELNEIVSRSLAAINSFDVVRRQVQEVESDIGKLERFHQLSGNASVARADMESVGQRIRNSGEKHNEAILAAMVNFVNEVDDEIRLEIALLDSGS